MRRPLIYAVLAGLSTVLAAIIVFSALRRREAEVQRAMANTVDVVVATRALALGSKITRDEVKVARWASDSVPPGSFTDPQAVLNAYAKGSFVAGEPIVAAKLFMGEKTAGVMPLLIPPGMRAMSVPVDEISDIAGFVLPRTRVDVLVSVTSGGTGLPSFSTIVLQDVEVLAVAQEIEGNKDKPVPVRVVTLLVTPEQAERLALASREGVLRLAMRNYRDKKLLQVRGVELSDLFRPPDTMPVVHSQTATAARPIQPHRPRPLRVEIFRDGRTAESVSFVRTGFGRTLRRLSAPAGGGGTSAAQPDGVEPVPAGPPAPADGPAVMGALPGAAPALTAPASASGPPAAKPSYEPAPKTIDVR